MKQQQHTIMEIREARTILEILKKNEELETDLYLNGEDAAGIMNKKEADVFWIEMGEALGTNTTCRVLTLNNCGMEDSHVSSLSAGLKQNYVLLSLRLVDNKISDNGAIALASALKEHPSLKELSLDGNQIGNLGAKALGDMLKTNNNLIELILSHNQIEDIGVFSDALEKNSSLIEL